MLTLNKIKHRITSIACELREDAAYAGDGTDHQLLRPNEREPTRT